MAATGPAGRRSSLFDVQKQTPIDSGSSSLSLSDVPSIAKRGKSIIFVQLIFSRLNIKHTAVSQYH